MIKEKPELRWRVCDVCGYGWWSRSQSEHPVCPRCYMKIGFKTRRPRTRKSRMQQQSPETAGEPMRRAEEIKAAKMEEDRTGSRRKEGEMESAFAEEVTASR